MRSSQSSERMERKRAEREDRILQAAEGLFIGKGFTATTVDEIASEADVSKGAVYLHYRSKEEVYFAIASRALELMLGMFEEVVIGPESGLERFRAIGRSFYRFTKAHPDHSILLYSADAPRNAQRSPYEVRCRSLSEGIMGVMVSTIEEGIADGSVRPDVNPMLAALTISSSLQGYLRNILVEKELVQMIGLDEERLIDYAIDLYGRSLMNTGECGSGIAGRK